jgi:hypothetical protein
VQAPSTRMAAIATAVVRGPTNPSLAGSLGRIVQAQEFLSANLSRISN